MAERLLKKKPHKVAAGMGHTSSASVGPCVPHDRAAVIVGTYKEKQLDLIKSHGIYNYPIREEDFGRVEHVDRVEGERGTGNGERIPRAKRVAEGDALAGVRAGSFLSVKELWLYADTKGTRHVFEAEFVGIKTRDELVVEYGYPADGVFGRVERVDRADGWGKHPACPKKPHASRYYVFKTEFLEYGSRLDDPIVIARTADFGGRSAKVKKSIEQFKADGEFAPLTHYLPSDLSKVPRSRLRVCEAAVQDRLVQWSLVVVVSPLLGKIESIVMSIGEFGRIHSLSSGESYAYLKKYKGLEYIDKYHEPLSCFPMESLVDDLARVCRNNGGELR